MTQTVSAAVATRDKSDQLVSWIRRQQDDIAMAAASHVKPSAIVRVTQGALRRDPKLLAAAIANPQSLLYALLDCARLGHEPDTDDYYLVPFGNEVTGIEGYKGIIERMFRAGAVSSVVAEVVRQRDVYRRTGATSPPVHEFDEFADPDSRGPLRGAYAYAVMLDGRFSKVVPMGRAEVMKHKAESRGSDRTDSPWQKWEESMWKKCPLRGLEPYVPTSNEFRTAPPAGRYADPYVITDQKAADVNGAGFDGAVYEAEIVDEAPAAQDDTRNRSRSARAQEGTAGERTTRNARPRAAGAAPSRGAQPPAPQDPEPSSSVGASVSSSSGRAGSVEAPEDEPGSVSQDQLTSLHIILGGLGFGTDDREQKLGIAEAITGRAPLTGPVRGRSSKNLSFTEARKLADTLSGFSGDREQLIAFMAEREQDGGGDE